MKKLIVILLVGFGFISQAQNKVTVGNYNGASSNLQLTHNSYGRPTMSGITLNIPPKQDSLSWLTLEQFGGSGDGVTDNSAAAALLNTAAPSGGGRVTLRPGATYVFNTRVVWTKPMAIFGGGISTIVKAGSNDMVVWKFAAGYNTIDGMRFQSTQSSPTAGCAVKLDTVFGGSPLPSSTINNCFFGGFYNCIESLNAYQITITGNKINFINYGVYISCVGNIDAGDSYIGGNNIFAPLPGYTGLAAIYQINSGGLKVVGNKFNYNGTNRFSYGYYGDLAGTSDLQFSANSFENYTINGIFLKGTSANFTNVSISGNQFSGLNVSTKSNIAIDKVDNLSIQGNVFTHPNGGGSDTAITLRDVNHVNISNTYLDYPIKAHYYGTNTYIVGDATIGAMAPQYTTAQRNARTSIRGETIYCTDCTATDGSTGVTQTWSSSASAWKNHW